jgi:hypothetical protein
MAVIEKQIRVCELSRVESAAPVKIDPAMYAAYAGKYLMDNGPVVDFTWENGNLMAQPAGGRKAEAAPESALKFNIASLVSRSRSAIWRAAGSPG